jgi:outer membrane protein OmpA-like peptidoglycan-associated protein
VDRNLQLGVAYNTKGFKDEDLDPDKQNKDGFFVNLTLKADEDMFAWLNWKKKKKDADVIDIPSPRATIHYEVENKPKQLAPRKYVEKVLSGSSYFATGSAILSVVGKQAIEALADDLKRSGLRKMDILVEGHTDSIGSETDNQLLSERRAESVALYLSRLGLDLMNMDIERKGEVLPIASNKTKAGRATNRRVNILINGIDRY